MVNVCIVNFNTQLLTDCVIKSVNKHTPDAKIYVFDNSDKFPFVNTHENVTVIDNTKGQIINFEEWLEKYPRHTRSTAKRNNYASAKHCYTIQVFMDMFKEDFVLLDSDALVKRDLNELVDKTCVFVGDTKGDTIYKHPRVIPFVCYINTPLCNELGVRYFDENYMHGLSCKKQNPYADEYDTGGAFYVHATKFKYKTIDHKQYCIHYKGGSWDDKVSRQYIQSMTPEQWVRAHKNTWGERNKKVVYTCISGPYDNLKDPKVLDQDYDYICFTDQNFKSDVWEMRPIPESLKHLSQVKRQRYIKVKPYEFLSDYDFSVWVDSNVTIKGSVDEFAKKNCPHEKGSIFIGEHPQRDCIYEEEKACLKYKKDTEENMRPQLDRYRSEGFPEHYGLTQSGIIFRYHNDEAYKKLAEAWWNEIENGSHRDQLSFNYVCWKNEDVKVNYLDKSIFDCPTFKWSAGHFFRPTKGNDSQKTQFVVHNAHKAKETNDQPKSGTTKTTRYVPKLKVRWNTMLT